MTKRTQQALSDLTSLLSAKLNGLSTDECLELLEELGVDVQCWVDVMKTKKAKEEP